MMDIVQRINELIDYNHVHNQRNDVQQACSLLCEARDEIIHLRSVAGAVSQGQTFEEIRRDPGIRSSTA